VIAVKEKVKGGEEEGEGEEGRKAGEGGGGVEEE